MYDIISIFYEISLNKIKKLFMIGKDMYIIEEMVEVDIIAEKIFAK